jgi:hypothetical protein
MVLALPWAKRISVFTKKSLKQQANTYMVHSQHTKGGKTFSAAHGETGEVAINCSDAIHPSQSQEFAKKINYSAGYLLDQLRKKSSLSNEIQLLLTLHRQMCKICLREKD